MNNRHLLLISYVFPPYPGIGGRRWAKMAKSLAREGYQVHVLTAKNPFPDESLWTADVQHERIHIHALPARYPFVLLKRNLNLWDKFAYRYQLFMLRRKCRGSIYDRALAWRSVMEEKATTLIQAHNIVNVIATGAPFRVLYYAGELKKKFPGLNVIADFRDPWTSGREYGFEGMSEENRSVELALERAVVEHADTIVSPAVEILDDLRKRYGHDEKFLHLPHCYDPDDFADPPAEEPFPEGTISFAFTGTIYRGLGSRLKELAVLLATMKERNPELYSRIRIDFFAGDHSYATLFAGVAGAVRFHEPLPPRRLFSVLRRYRFALVMFTEQYKDFLSTKFWELFFLRMPVVFLGTPGKVADFIREHDLGYAFTGAHPEAELCEQIGNGIERDFRFDIDTSGTACDATVRKLEAVFR